jgi:L-amino acid N-acyltransferase YncA
LWDVSNGCKPDSRAKAARIWAHLMITVRDLAPDELGIVTQIYAHHVLHGTATFEEIPPSLDEIARRHQKVRALGLPWLVAEAHDGVVAGYAYAAPFRERSAYRFTLENSVYIDVAHHRKGVGRALLTELLARCEALGYRQMIAVIGDSANHASIGLHRGLGFRDAGVYRSAGLKFGRWLDTVLMQRSLGDGDRNLPV